MTKSCPTDPAVRAYLRGELPPAELEKVAHHLDGCPGCDARAAALDAETDGVVAALRSTLGRVAPTDPAALPAVVGDYQILSEVGRGGMGVVYHARHLRLNRQAAVKMILSGRFAGPEEQMRFRIEGEMLARLRHPNVVEVYETGRHDGRAFLVLEWVGGGTLERLLTGPHLTPARAAELAELLADAVQHAHQNGVIHRDLKPANVLLTAEGTPKVTDFGLARPLTDNTSGLTVTGTVLGTPSYMAPEQTRGDPRAVGASADVYALGAILFALLTGRPPFIGSDPMEILHAVAADPPPAASRFRRGVPRDLDTIARRCLEKDPARRYPTAGELAADLRRWRTGRPIHARPVPFWERAYRFARRNPVPTAAGVLVVSGAIGAFAWVEGSRRAEVQARENESDARRLAVLGERVAREAAKAEAEARRTAERREALAAADGAVLRCEAGDIAQGLAEFARAREIADGAGDVDLGRALGLNQSAWTARLPRKTRPFDEPVPGYAIRAAAFVDGGRTVATGGGDNGVVKLWPTAGGPSRVLQRSETFFRRPDVSALFTDPAERVLYVAQGDNRIRRYNIADLTPAGPDFLFELRLSIQDAALSPDGRLLAAGEEGGTVRVWDVATGRPIGPDRVHVPPGQDPDKKTTVTAVAFADNDILLTGGRQYGVLAWNLRAGTPPGQFKTSGGVFRLVVHRDRQTVLVGGDAEVGEWLLRDPARPLRTWPHPARVEAIAVSPDGQLAATGDHAGSVRVWNLENGGLFTRFRHPDQLRVLRFAPDGRGLVVGGLDGTSALWELPPRPALAQGRLPPRRVAPVAGFTPDGRRVWVVNTDGLCTLEPKDKELTRVGPPLRPPPVTKWVVLATPNTVWSGAVSPDGRLAVTGGWHGETTRVWDVATGRLVGPPLPHPTSVSEAGFLPDGRTLYTRVDDRRAGSVRWWRVAGDDRVQELPTWPPLPDAVCLTPHPDGRRVLVGRRVGQSTGLRDVATGAEAGPPLPHPTTVTAAAVHPDARLAATGGEDGGVRVWELDAARPRGRSGFHAERVNRVAWGPGEMLASASDDGTARVWDARTMLPLGPPLRHPTAVLAVAFDSAGRRLVTVTRAGGVSVWPTPSRPDDTPVEIGPKQ